jgi:PAS domain S-box-containing protein
MTFQWFAFTVPPALALPRTLFGVVIVALYAALAALVFLRMAAGFRRLTSRQQTLLIACLAAALLLARFAVITFQPGGALAAVSLAPFALVPVVAAALWVGAGPAALTGLLAGFAAALFGGGRITQPFEWALFGAAVGVALNQPYWGRLAAWLRQPFVAAPAGAALVAWPLALLAVLLLTDGPALIGLERALALLIPLLLANGLAALAAGLIVQIALLRDPRSHPVRHRDLRPAPWTAALNRRVVVTFFPIALATVTLLLGIVAGTAYSVATRLVIDELARDAATAGGQVPFFVQVGRSLVRNLAQDPALPTLAGGALSARLEEGLRTVPFFQQLIYVDGSGVVRGAYPAGDAPVTLSPAETSRAAFALEGGVPTDVAVYGEGGGGVLVSFIAAVPASGGEEAGALVGRTTLGTNPTLTPVINTLREGIVGQGEGLIIDDQNHILLYPARPARAGETFALTGLRPIASRTAGQAFRQRQADGTRQLVYLLPVEGRSEWTVVMTVPNEVVLALALQIALPTLLVFVLISAGALAISARLIRGITEPLEGLAQAAVRIAEGDLDRQPDVSGEDEIGRLGRAFDEMRVRLARRLAEQDRLFNVSRSVASSLELFRAMPPILNAALDVTQAAGVRIALQTGDGGPLRTYVAGEAAAAMAVLDRQLFDLVELDGTSVVSQLWRAAGSTLDVTNLQAEIGALVAFPLRSERGLHGIMWVGYAEERQFEQSELNFLHTLAGQAAVAVANARLFAEAEEGRRKLEAVLESTADGMIVVDGEGRVVLINPAAAAYFGVRGEWAEGRPAGDVIDVPDLAGMMTDLREPVSVLELPHRDGKTLLANTSTIVGQDGSITGRVAVMRDITALKELDNIKTVFLQMVSHDLRSPLTYMRGYASMLPLEGDLNERQTEGLARINTGIDSIAELTERLTYLSRLRFGDEAELEINFIDVEELIAAVVEGLARLASEKDITIQVEVAEELPLVFADGVLYKHAVANLVQNALKYTLEGGRVDVRITQQGDDVTVAVTDNGIGIRPEDQEQLFEAFYRVRQRKGDPPRPKGSGLGLALVKAIAEAHGGSVSVESVFGEGSTFTITIPCGSADEV